MRNFFIRFLVSLAPLLILVSPVLATDKPAPSALGGLGGALPMMFLMFAIIYFLMIRPEQKKQKDKLKMMSALQKGDKIMTTSGLYGTVHSIKDTTFMIKIAENTIVEFAKNAVTAVLNNDGTEKKVEKIETIDKDKK